MMNDRRFMIGLISMNVVASWGKDLGNQIQDAIPKGSIVMKSQEDFETASMMILIYNKDFEVVAEGVALPKTKLDIDFNDKGLKQSPIVKPSSSIILPN